MEPATPIVCREIFDENSLPSAEEVTEYAQQIGIDPVTETHLLPLARDGLMQALPPPWKAYYDEKLKTHYYYNSESRKTQWEHPVDRTYKELVVRARASSDKDASLHDDTFASIQDLLTSDEPKSTDKLEVKHDSPQDDFSIDTSDDQASDPQPKPRKPEVPARKPHLPFSGKNLSGLYEKRLQDLKASPLHRSIDSAFLTHDLKPEKDVDSINSKWRRPAFEKPALLRQKSEIIDLKINTLSPRADESQAPPRPEKGLILTGKGSIFLKSKREDLPSPDAEMSMASRSLTEPRGILRDKPDSGKLPGAPARKLQQSLDDDKKSVRFKLDESSVASVSESSPEVPEESAAVARKPMQAVRLAPLGGLASLGSHAPLGSLAPLGPLAPLPASNAKLDSAPPPALAKEEPDPEQDRGRRLIRPPATEYIQPNLFQKQFSKIADMIHRGDDSDSDPDSRPRASSPLIPQKGKISINLMESIDSETSPSSPDKECPNIDLNDVSEPSNAAPISPEHSPRVKKKPPISPRVREKISPPNFDSKVRSSFKNDAKITKFEAVNPVTKDGSIKDESAVTKIVQMKISNSDDVNGNDSNLSPRTEESIKASPKIELIPKIKSPRNTDEPKALDNRINNHSKYETHTPVLSPDYEANLEARKRAKAQDLESRMMQYLDDLARDLKKRQETEELRMRNELNERLRDAEKKIMDAQKQEIDKLKERLNSEHQAYLSKVEKDLKLEKETMEQSLTDQMQKEILRLQKERDEAMENERIRLKEQVEKIEKETEERLTRLKEEKLQQINCAIKELEAEHESRVERARAEMATALQCERDRASAEHKLAVERMRAEHERYCDELRQDYRTEVERLRGQQAWHVAEVREKMSLERMRLASPRDAAAGAGAGAGTGAGDAQRLRDKYACLKEKYVRLKADVKMSIERRRRRREQSAPGTGSETDALHTHSHSHRGKEKEGHRNGEARPSERKPEPTEGAGVTSAGSSERSAGRRSGNDTSASRSDRRDRPDRPDRDRRRRPNVAFIDVDRPANDHSAVSATDTQESSDALNNRGEPSNNIKFRSKRKSKSASTSRLNCSPKCSGWCGPVEGLRAQLRRLDLLERRWPDFPAPDCSAPAHRTYPPARAYRRHAHSTEEEESSSMQGGCEGQVPLTRQPARRARPQRLQVPGSACEVVYQPAPPVIQVQSDVVAERARELRDWLRQSTL